MIHLYIALVIFVIPLEKVPLYIFVDHTEKSRQIQSELTRDWAKSNNKFTLNKESIILNYDAANQLNNIKLEINKYHSIIFINSYDERFPRLKEIPAFSLRKEVHYFPSETFAYSSSAIRTIQYICGMDIFPYLVDEYLDIQEQYEIEYGEAIDTYHELNRKFDVKDNAEFNPSTGETILLIPEPKRKFANKPKPPKPFPSNFRFKDDLDEIFWSKPY